MLGSSRKVDLKVHLFLRMFATRVAVIEIKVNLKNRRVCSIQSNRPIERLPFMASLL